MEWWDSSGGKQVRVDDDRARAESAAALQLASRVLCGARVTRRVVS